MKTLIFKYLTLVATTSKIVGAQENAWAKFGNCHYSTCDLIERAGAECCAFTDHIDLDTYFCMTDAQKGGNWQGEYTDDEGTTWSWKCEAPAEPETNNEDGDANN